MTTGAIPPREVVQTLSPYHAPPEGRLGMLRMDFCEWTGPLPQPVLHALHTVTADLLTTYPEYGAFIPRLADWIGVPENCALPFNGSDEALSLCIRGWVEPGDRVVVPLPTFSMILHYLHLQQAEIVQVPVLEAEHGPDFPDYLLRHKFDLKRMREELATSRMLIVPSPNNPSGSWESPEVWVDLAKEFPDKLIVVDEAYAEFAPDRVAPHAPKQPNLIVTGTFSKALGLAVCRLGWAAANPDTIRVLQTIRSPYSVNGLAVHLASAVLDHPDIIRERVELVRAGKERLIAGFRELELPVIDGYSNAVLVHVGEHATALTVALREADVLVRDLSKKPFTEGCLRVNAGTPDQVYHFFDEFRALFKTVAK